LTSFGKELGLIAKAVPERPLQALLHHLLQAGVAGAAAYYASLSFLFPQWHHNVPQIVTSVAKVRMLPNGGWIIHARSAFGSELTFRREALDAHAIDEMLRSPLDPGFRPFSKQEAVMRLFNHVHVRDVLPAHSSSSLQCWMSLWLQRCWSARLCNTSTKAVLLGPRDDLVLTFTVNPRKENPIRRDNTVE